MVDKKKHTLRRIIDISLVVVAAALLGGLALFLKPAVSADTVALLNLAAATGEDCTGRCTSTGSFCGSCARRAGDRLHSQPGVAWVKVDEVGRRMAVAYDSQATDASEISTIISRSGYENSLMRTMNMTQYDNAPECRSGKLLRQSPCGGACWNGMNKGEKR